MKVALRSFTDRTTYHVVDTEEGTCGCATFRGDGWCAHLEALGQFRPRRATLSARPSFSQALSAVVKSIRVRDVQTGAYWLHYCWNFRERLAGAQYRTARRLLIGAAEDGHSVAVMEKVADAFPRLLAKEADFRDALRELVRICAAPNWWEPRTGGHDYIYCGMVADRQDKYDPAVHGLDRCLAELVSAIDVRDRVRALLWVIKAARAGKGSGLAVAGLLLALSMDRNHKAAVRLMQSIYLRHARALADDQNFLPQAAWLLAGGASEVLELDPVVAEEEVDTLLAQTRDTPPYVVPGWCCDGIHCAGNDIRFTGLWARMYAVCRQQSHYGRVSVQDPWLEDRFYCLDGLEFRASPAHDGPRQLGLIEA